MGKIRTKEKNICKLIIPLSLTVLGIDMFFLSDRLAPNNDVNKYDPITPLLQSSKRWLTIRRDVRISPQVRS